MTTGGPAPRLTVPEALLSVGLVAWGLTEAVVLPSPTQVGVRVVFALLATVPLVWRNRRPVPVMIWALLVLTVQETFDVLSTEGVTPYQGVCLATYTLAAAERRGRWGGLAAIALVVAFPSFLLLMDTDGSFRPVNAVATALIQLTIVVAGNMVRTRRIEARRADELLREEARSAPARLAAAVHAERRTIAAELQALIVSDLAEMERRLAQARGALDDGDGVRAGDLAEAVQTTAARAVAEMRRLLLALGGELDEAPVAQAGPDRREVRAQWWRDRAADVAVITPLAVLLAAEIDKLGQHRVVAALAGAGAVLLPALARRRWPLTVAIVLSAGLVVREVVGLIPSLPVSLVPTLIVGAYAAGAHASAGRRANVGALVTAAGGLTLVTLQLGEGGAWPDLPVVLFIVACAFAAGELVRDNDGRILTLRAGTVRLAAELRHRRVLALEEERRRAARELHDVVAHGVSLVAVQAGAAAVTAPRDPEAARGAIVQAERAATQTRDDLVRLADALGVGLQAPPPGAADLRSLVASARGSGQTVELHSDGSLDALPPDVGVSLYRIVQEALTNARKHAPGAPTVVRVGRDARGGVTLVVRTAAADGIPERSRAATGAPAQVAPLPGAGRGIVGMTERARLLGGELSALPVGGGFEVRAALPAAGLTVVRPSRRQAPG